MEKPKRLRLGDLLIAKGIIGPDQLQTVLSEQKKTGKKIGQLVVEQGLVQENTLLKTLSEAYHIPFIDLQRFTPMSALIDLLPESHARRYKAIVLSKEENGLRVGMVDPLDLMAVDELQRILKRPLLPAFIGENELVKVFDRLYEDDDDIDALAGELEGSLGSASFELDNPTEADASDAPVVRLFQSIIKDAVHVKASDIHIEPEEKLLRVRYRVDGELQERIMKETRIAAALVLRIKIMSGLDISEKRIPQDGRFNIKVMNKRIDVRVSTMPIQFGEAVVMRLLDQSEGVLNIDGLGMPEGVAKRFRNLITRPYGILLVTGPTGSGKSTTLYAALRELNTPEKKIITVEDPVEYQLPRVNQVQVNPKIGLNFSKVLRTVLRQDPDIVMIGEMRDQETAEIGLRAALTGHFVLSTLHTNDAVSSATRLLDMGLDTFLVASALRGIVAQRLVRRICKECKTTYEPTTQEKAWLQAITSIDVEAQTFYTGKGCDYCNHTGHSGRIGVFEFLELDDEMVSALSSGDTSKFMEVAKKSSNFFSSSECAIAYAVEGITSLTEVFKITASLNESH